MGNRLNGGKLLGFGVALLALSALSMLVVLFAGFDWEPDEKPVSYWVEQILERQWIMAIGVLIPGACAAAATASMFARPRRLLRVVAATVITVLALGALVFNWHFGADAVDSAKYWATWYPGSPSRYR